MNKKKIMSAIKALAEGVKGNAKLIEENQQAISKLTERLEVLSEHSDYLDKLTTELSHALPDPEYDAKCEAQEADINASLDRHRERLGLNKPQLKQLDQSVFDGLDEKWRFAAVDNNGDVYVYLRKPIKKHTEFYLAMNERGYISTGYDATDWQNSLIERDDIAKKLAEVDLSGELTGSELCKAMLERGDKYVLLTVSDQSEEHALRCPNIAVGESLFYSDDGAICIETTDGSLMSFYIPINNQGEPLTASEVGL